MTSRARLPVGMNQVHKLFGRCPSIVSPGLMLAKCFDADLAFCRGLHAMSACECPKLRAFTGNQLKRLHVALLHGHKRKS